MINHSLQTSSQHMRPGLRRRGVMILVALAALTLALAPSAPALVITLTSGDPGGGYTPGRFPVYAYDVQNPGDGSVIPAVNTVQGVAFLPFSSGAPPVGFTVTGFSSNFEGAPDIGPTPNDNALEFINDYQAFAYNPVANPGSPGNGPLTLTIGGLTASKPYQLDIFVRTDITSRQENFTFTGGPSDSFTAAPAVYYDVRDTIVSDGSGVITVGLAAADNSYPFLNAFALSDNIPEPSTLLLFGLGGWLLRRRIT